jgi:FMN phosphatase YigB (HAD superfamily)
MDQERAQKAPRAGGDAAGLPDSGHERRSVAHSCRCGSSAGCASAETLPTPHSIAASPATTPLEASKGASSTAASPDDAQTDPRIREIYARIDSGRYDLLSLDIFDTVVWRMVPFPTDVFYLIANSLIRHDAVYDSSSVESFVRERIDAEVRARKKGKTTETTLDEIYAEFPRGYLRIPPEEAARIEIRTEAAIVRVDPAMRRVIQHARARGLRTAFVSDTYFSREQIRALVPIDVDHLILSCEHGVSKYHGLHRVLLERSGTAPQRILHIGDNPVADVEGPAAFQIETLWFRRFPDAFDGILQKELPTTFSRRAPYISAHDCGLSAIRSRAISACAGDYECWGAGVLGPIAAGFCDWVIEKCDRLGIHDALCLMREGRIIKAVLDLQGANLRTSEFFASRYVARKAAILTGSEGEIRDFVYRPSPQERDLLLEQLGLAPSDLPGTSASETLSPKETAQLIRRIATEPKLRRKVVDSSARARGSLLKHLETVLAGARPETLAVVDLGYRGTIQQCLQRILDHEGWEVRTHGLYLVTGGEVHATQAGGAAVEGWLAENGQPIGMAHTFMRSPEIVEQSLMADCGTTLGHESDGRPILDEVHIPEEQRRQILEIQRGALRYARAWGTHKREEGLDVVRPLKEIYQAICIRSVARPLPVELELFGEWRHDENFGSRSSRTLASVADLDEWERTHMSAHQLASIPMSRLHWPFGFAHRISSGMGEAVAHVFLRNVEPEAFNSASPPQYLIFYWDSGTGFSTKECSVQEYRLNNRGKVWQRFSLKLAKGESPRFGFSIGLPGQIVQLTGVILRYRPESGREQRIRIPHPNIEKQGYEALHGNLYLVREDPALLIVPGTGPEGFDGTVDVDIFFSLITEV